MPYSVAVLILTAGKGKRMKASLPKVLHRVGGATIIQRTINILKNIIFTQVIIVVNKGGSKNIRKLTESKYQYVIQKNALGTGDAVKTGLKTIDKNVEIVGVLYGDDTAFYRPETIQKVLDLHITKRPKITFVTVKKENPEGLGRIVRENGKLKEIIEEKEASSKQKLIKEVNDGVYFFDRHWLEENINEMKKSKVTGEYYLTDLIALALKNNEPVETYLLKDSDQWHGINNPLELASANLKLSKCVHFMGISGAGAAAVAGIAKENGYEVSGCDLNPQSPYGEKLNLVIEKGHSARHLSNVSALVVSPAVLIYDQEKNQEVQEAKMLGIPIITWQQFQGAFLQKDKFVIAVSGSYGKSTTTAMVAKILIDAKLDPTCEIGANVLEWGRNYRIGKSKYYVCEADEYYNNFLNYKPDIVVVLNIRWEHPDFFASEEENEEAFFKFVDNIKKNGNLIIASDSKYQKIRKTLRKDIKVTVCKNYGIDKLLMIGDFRKTNANFALEVANVLNLDLEKAKSSLKLFKGIERRLQYKGKINNVQFFDDYAVQPYTIRVTANALKKKFEDKRVLLVLEPHMYSRVGMFFNIFLHELMSTKVDAIYITDVFAAREKDRKKDLSQSLAKSLGKKAIYTRDLEHTAHHVRENLSKFDIVCSMGAGNAYKLYDLVNNIDG